MIITQQFVEKEIDELGREMANAREFLVKAQAALDVHKMLLAKLQAPEPEAQQPENQ